MTNGPGPGGRNMEARIIKTSEDHQKALAELEGLIGLDPALGTPEAEHLELLTLLVQTYEAGRFRIARPDPVSAIRFRMDQSGAAQRDLVPLLGSRGRVSEVLSGKRRLTLSMIRALHTELGIPADVLLQEPETSLSEGQEPDWARFPIKEMAKRGWITLAKEADARERAEELMREFLAPLKETNPLLAWYRRSISERPSRRLDEYALLAWKARVLIRAKQETAGRPYQACSVTSDMMQELAHLSCSSRGPRLAQEFLANHGITMLVEPHLPRTRLDGAAMLGEDGQPVVALTLRYDRIDWFWFSLMHELAHVALHVRKPGEVFVDDLEQKPRNPGEREADRMAAEALIPASEWKKSGARVTHTPAAIQAFAAKIKVHPAIVAGRIRFENRAYRKLSQLVGHGQVRGLFPPAS